jgi:hypothetical protein
MRPHQGWVHFRLVGKFEQVALPKRCVAVSVCLADGCHAFCLRRVGGSFEPIGNTPSGLAKSKLPMVAAQLVGIVIDQIHLD